MKVLGLGKLGVSLHMNMEQEMKAGLSQGDMLDGSYPKQLDPNIDPQILESLLWGPPKVPLILGNSHFSEGISSFKRGRAI